MSEQLRKLFDPASPVMERLSGLVYSMASGISLFALLRLTISNFPLASFFRKLEAFSSAYQREIIHNIVHRLAYSKAFADRISFFTRGILGGYGRCGIASHRPPLTLSNTNSYFWS